MQYLHYTREIVKFVHVSYDVYQFPHTNIIYLLLFFLYTYSNALKISRLKNMGKK